MASLSRFPGCFPSLFSSARKICGPHISLIHKQSFQICGESSYNRCNLSSHLPIIQIAEKCTVVHAVPRRFFKHSCMVNPVNNNFLSNPNLAVKNCKFYADGFSTVACKTPKRYQRFLNGHNELFSNKIKYIWTQIWKGTHSNTKLGIFHLNFSSSGHVRWASSLLVSFFRKSMKSDLPSGTKRQYSVSVQKNVSTALAVKRPSRKKPKTAEEMGDDLEKVVAYAVSDELNLSHLKEALRKQGLYDVCELPIDAQDALYAQAKYPVDEKKREIFFFSDGSAVFWSMPELERKEVLKFLRKLDYKGYPGDSLKLETEEMDLKFSEGPTFATNDYLHLSEDVDDATAALEKYAFSNALAQSVKLAVWESALDQLIDSMEVVVEDLRNDQKIRMSRREVLRHTGELFALRHLINLSSDLLDTPDFYWDRPTLEKLYKDVYNHHDIAKRTKVMNEKLSYCVELTELLSRNLNDAHHTRLEVMIIILIMVEVVFEIVHYLERFISG